MQAPHLRPRETKNSFNLVEIDTESGKSRVRFYMYVPDCNDWIEKDSDFTFEIKKFTKESDNSGILAENSDTKAIGFDDEFDHCELLAPYRNMLISDLQKLPLRGIDVGGSDLAGKQEKTELDKVYVALDTKNNG